MGDINAVPVQYTKGKQVETLKHEVAELREELRKRTNQRVRGTVKWFDVKNRYVFINRNDAREDIFVHQAAITRINQQKMKRSR